MNIYISPALFLSFTTFKGGIYQLIQKRLSKCTLFSSHDNTNEKEVNPDVDWMLQYNMLAENTMVIDESDTNYSRVYIPLEKQMEMTKSNIEELLSVTKKLNIETNVSAIDTEERYMKIGIFDHSSAEVESVMENNLNEYVNKLIADTTREHVNYPDINMLNDDCNNEEVNNNSHENLAEKEDAPGNADEVFLSDEEKARVRFLAAIDNFTPSMDGPLCPECKRPTTSSEMGMDLCITQS